MNEAIQKGLSKLEGSIGIQGACVMPRSASKSNEYMRGMYNGMVLAHSMFSGQSPTYIRPYSGRAARKTRVRHKGRK